MSDRAPTSPNIIVILADDLGFSDIGSYGGEIDTPALDGIAATGVRLSRFYNTARCSPSRASLMTGLHPHRTGIGVLTGDRRPAGYPGDLSADVPTLAEMLGRHGYRTGMTGKWHLSSSLWEPSPSWPTRRGFDYFYGTISGTSTYFHPSTLMRNEENVEDEAAAPDYYYTTAIGAEAEAFIERSSGGEQPFFLYAAFTAPHWPLHAPQEAVERYRGHYDAGWDVLRQERFERQQAMGLVSPEAELSPRDPASPAWVEVTERDWHARRMEVYAAQVSEMDRAVGGILAALERCGIADDTVVVFLSDNGASAEELPHQDPARFRERAEMFRKHTKDGRDVELGNHPNIVPGPESTYASYGRHWAGLSNTPFRRYKKWIHEGGIASPFIVRWPRGGLSEGTICGTPTQLTAVVPTLLEAAGVSVPEHCAGPSRLPQLRGVEEHQASPLYWEHCGNAGVRTGDWKLTREFRHDWELYDVGSDPTELVDVAAEHPAVVAELHEAWHAWADQNGVIPFETIVADVESRGLTQADAER